jgi:hypothetical protein
MTFVAVDCRKTDLVKKTNKTNKCPFKDQLREKGIVQHILTSDATSSFFFSSETSYYSYR